MAHCRRCCKRCRCRLSATIDVKRCSCVPDVTNSFQRYFYVPDTTLEVMIRVKVTAAVHYRYDMTTQNQYLSIAAAYDGFETNFFCFRFRRSKVKMDTISWRALYRGASDALKRICLASVHAFPNSRHGYWRM